MRPAGEAICATTSTMAAPEDVEHAVELRQRKSRIDRAPSIATRPFAGRIGGNQEFTVSPDDSDFQSVVTKQPDAAASFTWSESLSIGGFADVDLWKQATIEGVGTCLQTYLGGFYAIGLTPVITETSLGPITPAIFGALANVLLISLFIFSAGPVSGGHLNPMISMATFTAKLSAFPRTLLYIIFQCAGAVVAGFLVRASLGAPSASFRVAPGCYIDPALVTPGQAYVCMSVPEPEELTFSRYAMETMVSFAIIFIAFGVGLDPRQKEVFGPALSPILACLLVLSRMPSIPDKP
jgi:glycerol uptake facilitator-like aquaporin